MLRLDLINQPVSGNKYYKLKYNIEEAKSQHRDTLLTFGGAYSNHILATAQAGRLLGMKTLGVIRGEELAEKWQDNPTIRAAADSGMTFHFVSREDYRMKGNEEFITNLRQKFGDFYLVPEGGTNDLAVRGTAEILGEDEAGFNYICCSVGTGGTLAGIANSATPEQQILGFPALKGDFLKEDICNFTDRKNWELSGDYHFGGYARVNKELVEFINEFKATTGIPLDPVYTGKMIFGILDLVKNGSFNPGTSILAVHSGGLQGINGMNKKLKEKNLPLIEL